MAASGSILPIPKWYFVDNNGKPLGGGYLYTRLSSNPNINKLVYQDVGETLPYPTTAAPRGQAILLDLNGTTGPIFWASDVPYYIFVTDSQDNIIWDMDNFGPAIAGGGGGGNITTAIDLENLVNNGAFYRHAGTDNVPFAATQLVTLAPGAHAGLSSFAATTNVDGPAGPDITFNKNNLLATDTLTMGAFVPGADEFFPVTTPQYFLNYTCSVAGSGETYKYSQFPITSGAQNISNQPCTFVFWYRWNSGASTLTARVRQFYGDGSAASADSFATTTLTLLTDNLWHKVSFPLTVPDASGKTFGQCGNDGIFFEIEYPLDATCNIDIAKPAMYIGLLSPTQDYHTNDQIEAVVNEFRTGDVRSSLNAFSPFGWVPMNDGTIGSLTSGATTRADRDTFPLYNLLWTNVSDANAPVSGGRGASAVADFSANKAIALTKQLGRALAEAGTGSGLSARALGATTGVEENSAVPQHTHNDTGTGQFVYNGGTGGIFTLGGSGNSSSVTGGVTGGATATVTNIQPTSFVNMFIKL